MSGCQKQPLFEPFELQGTSCQRRSQTTHPVLDNLPNPQKTSINHACGTQKQCACPWQRTHSAQQVVGTTASVRCGVRDFCSTPPRVKGAKTQTREIEGAHACLHWIRGRGPLICCMPLPRLQSLRIRLRPRCYSLSRFDREKWPCMQIWPNSGGGVKI